MTTQTLFKDIADDTPVLVLTTYAGARAWAAWAAKTGRKDAPAHLPSVASEPTRGPVATSDAKASRRAKNAAAHVVALSAGIADAGNVSAADRERCAVDCLDGCDVIMSGRGDAGYTAAIRGALIYVHSVAPEAATTLARELRGGSMGVHTRALLEELRKLPYRARGADADKSRRTLIISASYGLIKGRATPSVSAVDASEAKTFIDSERAKRGLPVPAGDDLSVYMNERGR